MTGVGSLRWGELTALRRCDIDLEAGAVRITRQLNQVAGRLAFGPLKSAAGRRVVRQSEGTPGRVHVWYATVVMPRLLAQRVPNRRVPSPLSPMMPDPWV